MKYKAGAVTKAVGIGQDRLSQWFTREYIELDGAASGPGTRHEFTLEDAVRLAIFKTFMEGTNFKGEEVKVIAYGEAQPQDIMAQMIEGASSGEYKPIYWAAMRTEEGVIRIFAGWTREHFAELYDQLEAIQFMHVANITDIAREVKKALEEESA